jgi:hypothetical protein
MENSNVSQSNGISPRSQRILNQVLFTPEYRDIFKSSVNTAWQMECGHQVVMSVYTSLRSLILD